MNEEPNIHLIVKWLGAHGAHAGISESKYWTLEVLKQVATSIGVQYSEKTPRRKLIEDIVRLASKRIKKPIEELYSLSFEELRDYFESVGAEPEELLDLLKTLDLNPRNEGRKNLIEFAARELSETGRFMRIAGKR